MDGGTYGLAKATTQFCQFSMKFLLIKIIRSLGQFTPPRLATDGQYIWHYIDQTYMYKNILTSHLYEKSKKKRVCLWTYKCGHSRHPWQKSRKYQYWWHISEKIMIVLEIFGLRGRIFCGVWSCFCLIWEKQ